MTEQTQGTYTVHAQLVQHCHLLALPVPALDGVGRAAPENGELFHDVQV